MREPTSERAMDGDRRILRRAILIGALTVIGLAALILLLGVRSRTMYPYPAHQAYSFLQGRLDLVGGDPAAHDVSVYNGKVFAYWPPLASLFMMPVVAFTGYTDFPLREFALVFAGVNAALAYLIAAEIRRGTGQRSGNSELILALAFGFGTSNIVMGLSSNSWYIAQLVPSVFSMLCVLFALRSARTGSRRDLVICSSAFAAVLLGRSHMLLAFPLLAAALLLPRMSADRSTLRDLCLDSRLRAAVLCTALPVLFALGALLLFNYSRFDDPFETGLTYQNMRATSRELSNRYGLVNPRYLARNIYLTVLRPPGMNLIDGLAFPLGFGIIFQSPFLLFAFATFRREHRGALTTLLWLATLLPAIFLLCWVGSGFAQFGARYLFDVAPYLFALTVLALKREPLPKLFLALVVLSVACNAVGAVNMMRLIHLW